MVCRADESGDKRVRGPVIKIHRCARLLNYTVFHHDDKIGHGKGLCLVMGYDYGGHAETLLDLAQLDLHMFAQAGIQRRERFIKQKDLRVDRQAACDGDALTLTAGQLVNTPRAEAWQSDEIEQLFCPRPLGCLVDAANGKRIGDVFCDIEMREKSKGLEHHAHATLGASAHSFDQCRRHRHARRLGLQAPR